MFTLQQYDTSISVHGPSHTDSLLGLLECFVKSVTHQQYDISIRVLGEVYYFFTNSLIFLLECLVKSVTHQQYDISISTAYIALATLIRCLVC